MSDRLTTSPAGPAPRAASPLSAAEEVAVDRAVHFINAATVKAGMTLAVEVGTYLLRVFFDGDFAAYQANDPTKEPAFRALGRRRDLFASETTLRGYIRVTHQLAVLPPDARTRLHYTHHRALLALHDPEQKQDLARRAIDGVWTSRRLDEEIRALLPAPDPPPEPRTPPFVSSVTKAAKLLGAADLPDVSARDIAALPAGEREALGEAVEAGLAGLRRLAELLDRRDVTA